MKVNRRRLQIFSPTNVSEERNFILRSYLFSVVFVFFIFLCFSIFIFTRNQQVRYLFSKFSSKFHSNEKGRESKKMFRSIYFLRENRPSCRFCATVTEDIYTGNVSMTIALPRRIPNGSFLCQVPLARRNFRLPGDANFIRVPIANERAFDKWKRDPTLSLIGRKLGRMA